MSEMLRTGIVRLRRESDQQVVGVGFLVDATKRTILTCAHVVNAAIGNVNNQDKPRSLISIDFPFLTNGQRYDSRIVHFHPKGPDGAGDLAVLEIIEPLPETAKAVRLAVSETYNGHEFGVYGFPQGFEESGQYVEGRLQEQLANKRIQAIGTTNLGYFVEHGFSGSPVLDKQLDAVVGMMVQVDTEADKRVSFLSPIDVLAELFIDLKFEKLTVPNITPTKSHAGIQPYGKWLQRVDVFISSPSDVAEEREAILRVIERLNRLSSIRSRYVLNPLLYEKEVPPEAGDHAQMIVDRYMAVEDSYLLICLMWNRMGTPFTHPQTGEEFQSGTEYEFTIGYRANGKKGQPHLLLYRKTTEQTNTDKSEKEKVDNFFKRFEGKEATFKGLYKHFSSLGEFENMLFEHIERILHDNPPDTDRPDNRVDPDTRPDIIEKARRLDAAMPRECQLGRSTEVRVMICLPESEGLRKLLPDYTAEGDLIDKKDVREGNLAIAFPVDKNTGKPKPIYATVQLMSHDYDFDEAVQEIQLSPNHDSGLLVFSAVPRRITRRGRIHIVVKSKTTDGYVITFGSASVDSEIKGRGAHLVAQAIWIVLSVPFAIVGEGISESQKGLTAHAPNAEEYVNRGMTFDVLGRHERAIADFEAALRLDPFDTSAYINRGQSYLELGQLERAIADFEAALRLDPSDARPYNNRGQSYLAIGQLERAIADFDQAIRLNPSNTVSYNNRGKSYLAMKQYERAIADFDQAIRVDPTYAQAYNNRGQSYFALGQLERAIADFDQAVRLDPTNALAYISRGRIYADLGQYERAIADFDQAIHLNPHIAAAYNNRGISYQTLGQYERAIVDFDQAIHLNPHIAAAYNNRGISYQTLGQYERAIADFDQAIRLNPMETTAYYNRGATYLSRNGLQEAVESFRRARSLGLQQANKVLSQLVNDDGLHSEKLQLPFLFQWANT